MLRYLVIFFLLAISSCTCSKKQQPPIVADKATVRLKPLLILDAGHGGKDPGSVNDSLNLYEKNITRKMVDEVKKLIDTNMIEVVESRPLDSNINRHIRIANASILQPDLLISFHTNFNDDTTYNGFEISYCDSLFTKCTPTDTIRSFNPYKKELQIYSKEMVNNLTQKFTNMRNRGIAVRKDKIWMISGGNNFPSLLVEFGFISNRHDLAVLTNKKRIKDFASCIAKSVTTILTKKDNPAISTP